MVDESELNLEQELLRIQMEESREALASKIERLEEKVTETVESATASVAEATASVMETVQNASASVSETVGSVTDAVQGTVDTVRTSFEETIDSVKEAVNWRSQIEKRPVLIFAGAVAVGFVAGKVFKAPLTVSTNGNRKKQEPKYPTHRSRSNLAWKEQPFVARQDNRSNGFHSNGTEKSVTPTEDIPATSNSGWLASLGSVFAPELEKLQGLVIGTVLGSVRDLVLHDAPQSIQQPLAEVIDGFTEKLGGTCIHGSSTLPQHNLQ